MSNITALKAKLAGLTALAHGPYAPFKIAPIVRACADHPEREEARRTHQTCVATSLYMTRDEGADDLGILPPTYMAKADDLVAHGRRHPRQNFPKIYVEGMQIWQDVDRWTRLDPEDGTSGWHIILTLPGELGSDRQVRLVEKYIDLHLKALGMIVDYAVHAKGDEAGGWAVHPHAHLLVCARQYRDHERGQLHPAWLATAAQRDKAEAAWLAMSGLSPKPFVLG